MSRFRRYLIAGLLVWLPLGVTLLVIKVLVDMMDRVLVVLPGKYHPDHLLGFHIPGLGLVLSAIVVLLTGIAVADFAGRHLVAAWESMLARIPLVRTIYAGVKQIAETVFSDKGTSFRKVLLVEFPRKGIWSVAFYTGTTVGEVQNKTAQEVIGVFVPTTPNPTSGFFMLVPRTDVIELDMSVDEGIKMIMSMGMIVPGRKTEDARQALKAGE